MGFLFSLNLKAGEENDVLLYLELQVLEHKSFFKFADIFSRYKESR